MAFSLYATIPGYWCFTWIISWVIIVVFGRLIAVIGSFYFLRICFRKKTLNFLELVFISYGGTIRGVIAFALVMTIPYVGGETCELDAIDNCYSAEEYSLAKSTALVVVLGTTLLFGTFMKAV